MKSQKIKLTSRKFYNKWLYKISLRQVGCTVFRNYALEDVEEVCSNPNFKYFAHTQAHVNRDILIQLCHVLKGYDSKIWTKRIENINIDLYTNDVGFYQTVSDQFDSIVLQQFEPDPATVELLTNSNSAVAVKKLPHNRYQYKVYLLPHKMAGDRAGKIKFVEWLKTQGQKVTCSLSVEKWFVKTDWNWDRRYILVEDEATLLMLKLRNSEVVGRVYNYVLSDK